MPPRLGDHFERLVLGLGEGLYLMFRERPGGEAAAEVQDLHGVAELAAGVHAGLGDVDRLAEGRRAVLSAAAMEVQPV